MFLGPVCLFDDIEFPYLIINGSIRISTTRVGPCAKVMTCTYKYYCYCQIIKWDICNSGYQNLSEDNFQYLLDRIMIIDQTSKSK